MQLFLSAAPSNLKPEPAFHKSPVKTCMHAKIYKELRSFSHACPRSLAFTDERIMVIKPFINHGLYSSEKQTGSSVQKHHLPCLDTGVFTSTSFKTQTIFHELSSNLIFQAIENIFHLWLTSQTGFVVWPRVPINNIIRISCEKHQCCGPTETLFKGKSQR